MPVDRKTRDRWTRGLAGDEPVSDAEVQELRAVAERDGEVLGELLADARLDGWLRAFAWDREDGDAWSARLRERLHVECDADAFGRKVEGRIRAGQRRRKGIVPSIVSLGALAAVGVLMLTTREEPTRTSRTRVENPTNNVRVEPVATAIQPQAPPGAGPSTTKHPIAPVGPPEAILWFDFESGVQSPIMRDRPLTKCPPHPSSRFCLQARQNARGRTELLGVRFEDRAHGLFTYRPGMKLAFRYWVGAWLGTTPPQIAVWLNNRTQRSPYVLRLPQLEPVGWVRAEVPLADFEPEDPGPPGMRDGDVVDFLLISTGFSRQDVLFVDDVGIYAAP